MLYNLSSSSLIIRATFHLTIFMRGQRETRKIHSSSCMVLKAITD